MTEFLVLESLGKCYGFYLYFLFVSSKNILVQKGVNMLRNKESKDGGRCWKKGRKRGEKEGKGINCLRIVVYLSRPLGQSKKKN